MTHLWHKHCIDILQSPHCRPLPVGHVLAHQNQPSHLASCIGGTDVLTDCASLFYLQDIITWLQVALLLLMRRVISTLMRMMAAFPHHAGLSRTRQPGTQHPLSAQPALKRQKPKQLSGGLPLLTLSMSHQPLYRLLLALSSLPALSSPPAQRDQRCTLQGLREQGRIRQAQAAQRLSRLLTYQCLVTSLQSRRATSPHRLLSPVLAA